MHLTPDQQAHIRKLLLRNQRMKAIQYCQETLHLNAFRAQELVDAAEKEIKSSDNSAVYSSKNSSQKPSTGGIIGGTIFLIIGLGMLGFTTHLFLKHQDFMQRAMPVMSTVTEYEQYESSDDDGGSTTMYTPVFEYSWNGKNYRQASDMSSSSQDYAIGESVELLIDPDNPQAILINSFMGKWLLPILLGMMGTIFTLVGFSVIRIIRM